MNSQIYDKYGCPIEVGDVLLFEIFGNKNYYSVIKISGLYLALATVGQPVLYTTLQLQSNKYIKLSNKEILYAKLAGFL